MIPEVPKISFQVSWEVNDTDRLVTPSMSMLTLLLNSNLFSSDNAELTTMLCEPAHTLITAKGSKDFNRLNQLVGEIIQHNF